MNKHPLSETLLVGGLLAFAGGFLDAYTYILRGGVFANAQTGNLVLLGIRLSRGEISAALLSAVPIIAFVSGVFITRWLLLKKERASASRMWIVAAEAVLLFIAGFLPADFPDGAVTVTVSFVCALQVSAFRSLYGLPYATTMCTGNLRSAVEKLAERVLEGKKKSGTDFILYMSVILIFCAGAAGGVFLISVLGRYSIWLCSGIYLLVLLLIRKEK